MDDAQHQSPAAQSPPIVFPSTITVNINSSVGTAVLAVLQMIDMKLDALLAAAGTDPAAQAAIATATATLKLHSDRAKAALDAANIPTA
jgi:hypothetical protein